VAESTSSPIEQLFEKARKTNGIEYLFVLVRIDGMQCYDGYKDEIVALRELLNQSSSEDLTKRYQALMEHPAPLELLQNLLNVSSGKHYSVRGFAHLVKGRFPHSVWPTVGEKVEALISYANASSFPELAQQISASYRPSLLVGISVSETEIAEAVENLSKLLGQLLRTYFEARLEVAKHEKYIKLPNSLDVLELVSDPEYGLSGLRVHFSQGCSAEFVRTPTGVVATNLEFGPPVTFLMMSDGPSTNEYRVEGKRLYEIGIPGRYNKLGEWKPIIYPGKSDALVKEAAGISKDPDVQGTFLYMLLTGYKCIEFVISTNLDMPGQYTVTEDGGLHMWKCPPEEFELANTNLRIYDCWLELEGLSDTDVERGLAGIGYFVNVLCFPFGASYNWRIKYRMTTGGSSLLTPTHDDCKVVDSIIKKFPNTPDSGVLASAIDWYNRGTISTNIFNSFLCYYIALESLAVAIADGAELGLNSVEQKQSKQDKKSQSIACIHSKHESLFATDPIRFVNESYFECVQSVTAKTKAGVKSIFGDDHKFLTILFEKSTDGDMPLKDLRSELAHGYKTILHKGHEELVRKHLHELGTITREFLLRVLFRLQPTEAPPTWSGAFQQHFVTVDPRSTMVASTEKIFPKDAKWAIRAEWCEH
jgi:hypothetical protein